MKIKVGDLIKHWSKGPGIVIALSEPTFKNPYQLATVYFNDGETDDLVVTSLYPYTLKTKNSLDK